MDKDIWLASRRSGKPTTQERKAGLGSGFVQQGRTAGPD